MTISKNTNRIPSICKLSFVFVEEIKSMVNSIDLYHKWIVLKTGLTWREIYFTAGSAEFSEVQKNEDAGPMFNQTLKFIFPGEDDDNTLNFDSIITRPLVIIIEYSNGAVKLLGSTDKPARVVKSQKTDSKGTGQEFTATCSDICQAFWLLENPS